MKVPLVAIVLLATAQLGMGTARADDATFLTELNSGNMLPNVSFTQSAGDLLNVGYQVCANTSAGMEQRAMIRDVWHNSGFNFDAVQATVLVRTAQLELCPV